MFTLYRIALALERKPYRIDYFCSHIRTVIPGGDFWRDFCNGAKLRLAGLESEASHFE